MSFGAFDPSVIQNIPGGFMYPPPLVIDPWLGSPTQTSRLKAYCDIYVGGVNITDRLEPHNISVRVRDGDFSEHGCEIEIDDRDARLPIPPINAAVQVDLGWQQEYVYTVFVGRVAEIEYGFGRKEGGRRMWVHARGQDQLGLGKSPMQNSWGEGAPAGQEEGEGVPASTPLQEAAQMAGHNISIHPAFQGMMRDFWSQGNMSYYHFAQQMADELGAKFRVVGGNQGEFTKPGEDPDGSSTTNVVAQWGDNLIGCRVKPFAADPVWGQTNQQYYSSRAGQWKTVANMLGNAAPFNLGTAAYALPAPAGNASAASQQASGAGDLANAVQGPGRIVMNGEPRARWQGRVQLSGVRPGVDATYIIEVAEHLYSRHGYVTWLEVYIDVAALQGSSIGAQMAQAYGNALTVDQANAASPFKNKTLPFQPENL